MMPVLLSAHSVPLSRMSLSAAQCYCLSAKCTQAFHDIVLLPMTG